MRYTPEQKEQALTLSRQPGATAGSVSRQMGIPARAIQRWIAADAKQKAAPDNVTSLMEQRERARQISRILSLMASLHALLLLVPAYAYLTLQSRFASR